MIFEWKDYKMDQRWIVLCCKTLRGDMLHSLFSWCCFHLLFLYFQYNTISNSHIILFNLEWSSCSSLIIVQMILNSDSNIRCLLVCTKDQCWKKKKNSSLFVHIRIRNFLLTDKKILSFIPSNMQWFEKIIKEEERKQCKISLLFNNQNFIAKKNKLLCLVLKDSAIAKIRINSYYKFEIFSSLFLLFHSLFFYSNVNKI